MLRMKNFPAGRPGVLLPIDDRKAAALGISMYTASRPRVLAAQRAAHALVSKVGARALPGRAQEWRPPCSSDEWEELVRQWRDALGGFDRFAAYQRRQTDRGGLTLLLVNRGEPLAVVKLRTEEEPLAREQTMLKRLAEAGPTTFRTPSARGSGRVAGDLNWSAQSAVFTAPHAPELDPPDALFDELERCLAEEPPTDDGQALAHNDLTPWNLRRDLNGDRWLFDWEDTAPAPVGADRVYFAVAAHALAGRPVPHELPRDAIAFWSDRIAGRSLTAPGDRELAAGMERALKMAQATTGPVG